jgi:hypothetical protein
VDIPRIMPGECDAVKRGKRMGFAWRRARKASVMLQRSHEPFRVQPTPGDRAILVLLQQHAEAHASASVTMAPKLVKAHNLGITRPLRMGGDARSDNVSGRDEQRADGSLEHWWFLGSWFANTAQETLNQSGKPLQ